MRAAHRRQQFGIVAQVAEIENCDDARRLVFNFTAIGRAPPDMRCLLGAPLGDCFGQVGNGAQGRN